MGFNLSPMCFFFMSAILHCPDVIMRDVFAGMDTCSLTRAVHPGNMQNCMPFIYHSHTWHLYGKQSYKGYTSKSNKWFFIALSAYEMLLQVPCSIIFTMVIGFKLNRALIVHPFYSQGSNPATCPDKLHCLRVFICFISRSVNPSYLTVKV